MDVFEVFPMLPNVFNFPVCVIIAGVGPGQS